MTHDDLRAELANILAAMGIPAHQVNILAVSRLWDLADKVRAAERERIARRADELGAEYVTRRPDPYGPGEVVVVLSFGDAVREGR